MKVVTLGKKVQLRLPAAEDFAKTGILFLISRSVVMDCMPFGISFWAAAIPSRSAYLGLLGMCMGIFTAGGDILKYTLAAGVYLVYTFFRKNKITDPLFCGFSVVVGGIFSVLFSSRSAIYLLMTIPEGILAALGYLISRHFVKLLKIVKNNARASREEVISAVILCGIMLTGFSGIYITDNIHLCMLLGIYLILCISGCVGTAAAGSIGLALGFICSMNTPSAMLVTGICGAGAILANLFKDFGRGGCCVGFLLAAVISAVYTGDFSEFPITVYEYAIASVMLFVTPRTLLSKAETFALKTVKSSSAGKEIRLKEYLSGELKHIAKAFTDLAESFLTSPEQTAETVQTSDMFDEVAERVCKDCPAWGKCWIDGFNDMYHQMYEILNIIENNGFCDEASLPTSFKEKCIRAEAFLGEFNHLYEICKQHAMWKGEAKLGQDMVAHQYNEISKLIKGLSEEVETGFSFIESAELKLDTALERAGVFAGEINVIENLRKEPEVYISADFGGDTCELEQIVSNVMGIPMRLENNASYMKFVTHNKYYAEYAVCQHSGEGDGVCGDTVMHFETEDNKFCVLLCDGMGAGSGASEESRLTAELLQDFLKAGFIKSTAVKMINSTLAMKSGNESFSTVDMLEIDLRSGACEFLKVGAAQSFLTHNGKTEIITQKTLPVGIVDDIQVPVTSRRVTDGDIIVMASDGISETGYGSLKGMWIKDVIENAGGNMQHLADEILKNAREKSYPRPCDDMTVAVIKIKRV